MTDFFSLLTDESKQKVVKLFELQRRLGIVNQVIEANDPNGDEVSKLLDMFQNAGVKKDTPNDKEKTISASFLYTWKKELEADIDKLTEEVTYIINVLGSDMWIKQILEKYVPQHQDAVSRKLVECFISDKGINMDEGVYGEGFKAILIDLSKYVIASLGSLLDFYEQELKNGSTKPPEN